MRIRVTDAAGNWREWNIFTKATLPHLSWIAWAVHTTAPYDAQSATPPSMTAIRKVGWRIDAVVAKVYIYRDAWRYGTGLTIYGGTSSDPATFEVLYTSDSSSSNAYGVIDKFGGVFYIQGTIKIGSITDGQATYFKDTSKVVVFKKGKFTNSTHGIKFQGNATALSEVYFGDEVGGRGVSGLFISSEDLSYRFALDATSIPAGGMTWKLCGTTFFQARRIELPTYSVDRKVISCNFESCWEVYPSTTLVKYCNFIAPSGETPAIACRFSSTAHNITYSNFISCSRATHITVTGTFTFEGIVCSGNTYDVRNSSGGAVTINLTGGSVVDSGKVENIGASTTEILAAVTLKVTVKDEAGNVIANARVAIQRNLSNPMKGAVADDGGVQTDETTAANNATANDMTLLPAVPAVDDAYYFGAPEPFYKLRINIGQNGAGVWTIVWEYWNGASWASIPDVTDKTNGFRAGTGNKEVAFSPPNDWATTTVKAITCFWIRARVSSYTSVATQPLGTQSWVFLQIMNELTTALGVAEESYNYAGDEDVAVKVRKSPSGATRYFPLTTAGKIESSGYTATVVLIEDKIAA